MSTPNQTAQRWRLGPRTPMADPWGKGAWDSKCDLYDVESDERIVNSGIGDIAPPQAFTSFIAPPVVPPLGNQVLFSIFTPPCDRFALFISFSKQIGGNDARPAPQVVQTPLSVPSPWVVQLRRGMDCVDEPSPATPAGVIYTPKTFKDNFGLILELFGTPLSTYWTVYAYQATTIGTDIGWQAAFRVMADRIGCCPEGVAMGPNTTLPDT